MGGRIADKRVFENNLHSLHSADAPPLGSYDPVNPRAGGFEDKAKIDLIKAHVDPTKSRNLLGYFPTEGASDTNKNSGVSLTLPKTVKPYSIETISPHTGKA